jgi:hypothetical protein
LFFIFYYFDGHRQLTESAIYVRDDWIKHESSAEQTFQQDSSTLSFKSTCSAAADRRGPHQKVIGYSMYGSNFSDPTFYNSYLKWFGETLRAIPIKYPGA